MDSCQVSVRPRLAMDSCLLSVRPRLSMDTCMFFVRTRLAMDSCKVLVRPRLAMDSCRLLARQRPAMATRSSSSEGREALEKTIRNATNVALDRHLRPKEELQAVVAGVCGHASAVVSNTGLQHLRRPHLIA